jgi:hypothetical protein
MYLGIAVSGSILLVSWGLRFENILEIKELKELTNENSKKGAEPASAPEGQASVEKVGV